MGLWILKAMRLIKKRHKPLRGGLLFLSPRGYLSQLTVCEDYELIVSIEHGLRGGFQGMLCRNRHIARRALALLHNNLRPLDGSCHRRTNRFWRVGLGIAFLSLACVEARAEAEIKRDPTEMKVEGNDYASVRTFVVPIVKQDQVVAYALVNMGITFGKLEELDRVWLSLPKIRHDIFMYLYELLGVLWTPTATPDRDEIQKKVEEIFKKHAEGVVKSVSIGNIEIHQTGVDGEDAKPFFVPQVASP
jgi:hypothetical protein